MVAKMAQKRRNRTQRWSKRKRAEPTTTRRSTRKEESDKLHLENAQSSQSNKWNCMTTHNVLLHCHLYSINVRSISRPLLFPSTFVCVFLSLVRIESQFPSFCLFTIAKQILYHNHTHVQLNKSKCAFCWHSLSLFTLSPLFLRSAISIHLNIFPLFMPFPSCFFLLRYPFPHLKCERKPVWTKWKTRKPALLCYALALPWYLVTSCSLHVKCYK